MRYGVVDVGSNGIRMLMVEVRDSGLETLERRREPIRLGQDVYRHGSIGRKLLDKVVAAFQDFRQDFDRADVQQVRAIATAASREARNRDELVARVKLAAGIEIEVISGDREAELLALAVQGRMNLGGTRTALLDLGGGSIEVGAVANGKVTGASFPLGALRILAQAAETVAVDHGDALVTELRNQVHAYGDEIAAILGEPHDQFAVVGGSMETLVDLASSENETRLVQGVDAMSLTNLQGWMSKLAQLTSQQRRESYRLPEERVDTVVPASLVTCFVARLAGVDQVLVPRVDLRHGLLEEMRGATLATEHGDD